jgi:hypothetical protein
LLQRDAITFEHRAPRTDAQAGRGAVDMDLPGIRGNGPRLRGASVHRRFDALVEANEVTVRFQPCEQLVDTFGFRGRFELVHDVFHDRRHEIERLCVGAVEHPGVARADPTDRIGLDAVVEHSVARVHCGLARADHRVAPCRLGHGDEIVDGMKRASGSMSNDGTCVAGIGVSR